MTKLSKKMMVALLCFSASLSVSVAQENEPKIATDLNTLITKSSSYQNYKVIEKNAIYGFQNSLNTFIKEQEQIQNTLNKEIAENKKSILLLQNELVLLENKIDKLETLFNDRTAESNIKLLCHDFQGGSK